MSKEIPGQSPETQKDVDSEGSVNASLESAPATPAKGGIGIVPVVAVIAGLILLYVFVAKPNPAGKDAAKSTKMTREVMLDARRAAAAAEKQAARQGTPTEDSLPVSAE